MGRRAEEHDGGELAGLMLSWRRGSVEGVGSFGGDVIDEREARGCLESAKAIVSTAPVPAIARLDLRRVGRSSPTRREDRSSGGGRSDPLFGAEVVEAAGERDSAGQRRVDDPKHRMH